MSKESNLRNKLRGSKNEHHTLKIIENMGQIIESEAVKRET